MPIVQCMLSTCLYERDIVGRASLSAKCFPRIFFLQQSALIAKSSLRLHSNYAYVPSFQDSLSKNVDLGRAFAIFWENKGLFNLFLTK